MTGESAVVIGPLFAVVLVISILKGGFGGGFGVLGVLACYALLILVGLKLLADWALHIFFAG